MVPSLDELPMDPPAPSFCGQCGAAMTPRKDRRTGRAATRGWKAVLQCGRCGAVEIGQDPVSWGRRFTLIRRLIVIASGALVLADALWNLRDVVFTHFKPEYGIILVITFCVCFLVHNVVTCVAYGLSPQVPAKERFECWFLAAFWSAPLGMMLWVLFTQLTPWLTKPPPPTP